MLKQPHHTQTKLAAKFGAVINVNDDGYSVAKDGITIVPMDQDLKAVLAKLLELAEAEGHPAVAKPAKARKAKAPKARKVAKRRVAREDDEDGEGAEEDSEEEFSTVVKPKYKAIYNAHKGELHATCADTMARAFREATTTEDDELDLTALVSVCAANGLTSYRKYMKVRSRGWQGRFRMTVGNILRGMIRRGTDVVVGDRKFPGAKVEG